MSGVKLYRIVCRDESNDINQRVYFARAYGEKEALEKASHDSLMQWFRGKNRNTKFIVKREILENDFAQEDHTVTGKKEKNKKEAEL